MTSLFRRSAAEQDRLIARVDDPPAVTKRIRVYPKLVSGVAQLFARASDGTVSTLTPGATVTANIGGTRSETRRGGADILEVIEIAADPAPIAGRVILYAKNVAGVTQLFSIDSAGSVIQITPHLTVAAVAAAVSSETRRAGAEQLVIIGRTDDPTAIAGSIILYSKIVGSTPQLFAMLSNGVPALLSEGPLVTAGTKPNQIYAVNDSNAPAWLGNFPIPTNGHYWEYENGAAATDSQGLNAWVTSPAGAGAVRVGLTTEAGWFQNACSFSTGTTSTGANGATRQVGMAASAASGLLSYEITTSLPTLSDGTDSYYWSTGFNDNQNPTLTQNGVYVRYTHTTNGGRFELVSASGGTRTAVDTGVTVVAGNYYHIRVTLLNNTLGACYIKTVYSGGAWSDDGIWGAPTATVATNIPTGNTSLFIGCTAILKYVGTNPRLYKMGFQMMDRVPSFTPSGDIVAGTGLQKGDIGTAIAVNASGLPEWLAPLRIIESPIIFYAYQRGAWIPAVPSDFGSDVGGSGGNGSGTGIALDNNWWGTTNLNTSTPADGYAFYRTSFTLQIDTYVAPMVLEAVIEIPTLSSVAQQFKTTFGLFNQVSTVLTRGITIELDTVANTAFQCVVTGSGGTTTTSSGLVAVAGTRYLARIIVTATSIDFYIVADGVTTLTTPVATITTNIPTGVALGAGMGIRKIAGTTNRTARYGYLLAYQRSAA